MRPPGKNPGKRAGRFFLRRIRPRFVLSGLWRRNIPAALVRWAKGGSPGRPEDRTPPSRAEAGVGAVLYALLIPFGWEAFRDRSVFADLTGILLVAIGVAGVLGLGLRNLGPKSGRRP